MNHIYTYIHFKPSSQCTRSYIIHDIVIRTKDYNCFASPLTKVLLANSFRRTLFIGPCSVLLSFLQDFMLVYVISYLTILFTLYQNNIM